MFYGKRVYAPLFSIFCSFALHWLRSLCSHSFSQKRVYTAKTVEH